MFKECLSETQLKQSELSVLEHLSHKYKFRFVVKHKSKVKELTQGKQ
jgi:hypothetical protein